MTRTRALAVIGLLQLGAVRTAAASPGDLVGLDAGQIGAATPIAIATSPAGAILGAPAALAASPDHMTVTLAWSHGGPAIRMRARPALGAGFDIDDSIYGARPVAAGDRLRALATADLPARGRDVDIADQVLLVLTDVRRLARWATLGVVVALPVAAPSSSTFYADEREASFSNRVHLALLEDARTTSVLAASVGVTATPWLRLGAGAVLTIGAAPSTRVYLPNALEPAVSDTNTELGIVPAIAPILGAEVDVAPHTTLVASVRTRSAQHVDGDTTIRLWVPADQPIATSTQPVRYAIDSQPLRAAIGVRTRLAMLGLGGEAVYRRGADYVDEHDVAAGLDDAWELGATAEAVLLATRVTAGLRFVDSPVPAQTGATNVADADRVVAGVALGRAFDGGHVVAQLGLGVQRLVGHEVVKDPARLVDEYPASVDLNGDPIAASAGLQTNNPGFPGYAVGGWLGTMALTVSVYL